MSGVNSFMSCLPILILCTRVIYVWPIFFHTTVTLNQKVFMKASMQMTNYRQRKLHCYISIQQILIHDSFSNKGCRLSVEIYCYFPLQVHSGGTSINFIGGGGGQEKILGGSENSRDAHIEPESVHESINGDDKLSAA